MQRSRLNIIAVLSLVNPLQGKLAEKRGLPPSGAARPAAKALPVSVPRAAARGGRTAGRGAGRGAHGAGRNVGAAARGPGGARAREVGRGGGQGGAVIMPTSMRITIFNELVRVCARA